MLPYIKYPGITDDQLDSIQQLQATKAFSSYGSQMEIAGISSYSLFSEGLAPPTDGTLAYVAVRTNVRP